MAVPTKSPNHGRAMSARTDAADAMKTFTSSGVPSGGLRSLGLGLNHLGSRSWVVLDLGILSGVVSHHLKTCFLIDKYSVKVNPNVNLNVIDVEVRVILV